MNAMSPNDERIRELISQQAADWLVANRAGLSAKERDGFAAWLNSSPLHVEEYLALSVIAHDLRDACESSQTSLDELLARARLEEAAPVRPLRTPDSPPAAPRFRWGAIAAGVAACGVLGLALLFGGHFMSTPRATAPPAIVELHFQTRHGEQLTRRLADNSVVHLNTDSAVTIRYGQTERTALLTSGEAAFEVAHVTGRIFRVFAGTAQIVDVGTRFDVRLTSRATVVTVSEGSVDVGLARQSQSEAAASDPQPPAQFVRVGPDQQLSVAAGSWPAAPVAADAERTTAWLHRQITFEREPLERVANEFNRYSPKQIEITTPALRNLEISGVFATDDTEAFIAFLRSLKGVHVEVTATRIRVSQD
jgi:transmembrane sensor